MKEGINHSPEPIKLTVEQMRAIVDEYYPTMAEQVSDEALQLLVEQDVVRLDPFDTENGGLIIHSEEDGI